MNCSVEEKEVNQLGFLKEITEDVRDILAIGIGNVNKVEQGRYSEGDWGF